MLLFLEWFMNRRLEECSALLLYNETSPNCFPQEGKQRNTQLPGYKESAAAGEDTPIA